MSRCHCRRHADIDDDVSDIIGSAAAQAAITGIVDYQEKPHVAVDVIACCAARASPHGSVVEIHFPDSAGGLI
jgi:hypothetical protein